VKEEKRSSYDNQAYAPAQLQLHEDLFKNWTNAHNVIGSFEDLDAASIKDVQDFFHTFYRPNNAVLAIVGDVDSENAAKLVQKYFGTIASKPIPKRPDDSEPEQTKSKFYTIADQNAKSPLLMIGWKAPPHSNQDYYPLQIAQELLAGGDSSMLYQNLVKGNEVAIDAASSFDDDYGPTPFWIQVAYKPENSPNKIRDLVYAQINKLASQPVAAVDLEKARNEILHDIYGKEDQSSEEDNIQLSQHRAVIAAEDALFFNDPDRLDKDIAAYNSVQPADIQRVVAKYLAPNSAIVGDVVPAKQLSAMR
jgi:zinc protease